MEYVEFLFKMKEIKAMGYAKSHRAGDTGIGKTLEDLLGIEENNIAGPDFSTYELKAARKDSVSMLTLFTKTPEPKGANKRLLEVFGYRQRTQLRDQTKMLLHREERIDESSVPTRDKELHVTVDSTKPNSVGLKLEISGEKIIIANQKGVEAYYHSDTLRQAFEKKYEKLVYVLAEHKKEQTSELFWYNEAFLLHGFDSKRFLTFVGDGLVKLDLRLGHYEDGRPHDHGTCFRVLPKYLPQCFESVQKIL